MTGNVGIVIVSHSFDVAKGAADMVRQMVGEEVASHFAAAIPKAASGRTSARSCARSTRSGRRKGLAIMVDLGGAETNSEMAVEMLPAERRGSVVICNAPIVEGAVMAAAEAAGGGSLERVRAAAEELSAG